MLAFAVLALLGWGAHAFLGGGSGSLGVLDLPAASGAGAEEPTTQAELVSIAGEQGSLQRIGVSLPDSSPIVLAQGAAAPESVLRGVVVDASGVLVARALVALIELDGLLQPKNDGERAVVRADEQGAFELGVPAWACVGEVLLVARSRGWQPYSEVLHLDPAEIQRAQSLALGEGLEVWGRVVRDGLPVEGAHAWIDAKYLTPGVFGAGEEAWWAEGRLENKLGQAKTAMDGVFRIPGMGAGEFRLDFGLPEGSAQSTVSHLFSARSGEFQVYDLSASYLLISVHDPSGPVADARVHVTGSSGHCSFLSTEQPTRVAVEPGGNSKIEVLLRGYETLTMPTCQAPPVGGTSEVELVLERQVRPSLTVQLPGAETAGVEWISLTLHRGELASQRAGPAVESLHLNRTSGTDEFHASVLDVEPGLYLLAMGASSQRGVSACLKAQAKPMHVPAQGAVVVAFELGLWGSFEVQANVHFPQGQGGYVRMRVRDASERVVAERTTHHWTGVEWVQELDEDGEDSGEFEVFEEMVMDGDSAGAGDTGWRFNGVWAASESGPAGRWGLLPAGNYQLEVGADGHTTWRGSISLVTGKHTVKPVTLNRKAND